MTTEKIEFKENDMFLFRYNAEETQKRFEPYHCFDGKLIVKKNGETGELYLCDTYWGNSASNKTKTFEQAKKEGSLQFYCNLDEVEKIHEGETKYLDQDDWFDLSSQHGCYKQYAKRKGAVRSQKMMLFTAMEKIAATEQKIKSYQRDLERLNEALVEIERGNLSLYI